MSVSSVLKNNENIEFSDEELHAFIDPITQEEMEFPVITRCGHTFEREAVESWFAHKSVCPMCRNDVNPNDVVDNFALQNAIEQVNNLLRNMDLKMKGYEETQTAMNLEINSLKTTINDQGSTIKDLQTYIEELRAENKDKDEKIERLTKHVIELVRTIPEFTKLTNEQILSDVSDPKGHIQSYIDCVQVPKQQFEALPQNCSNDRGKISRLWGALETVIDVLSPT